jgi:hypothetical protein
MRSPFGSGFATATSDLEHGLSERYRRTTPGVSNPPERDQIMREALKRDTAQRRAATAGARQKAEASGFWRQSA